MVLLGEHLVCGWEDYKLYQKLLWSIEACYSTSSSPFFLELAQRAILLPSLMVEELMSLVIKLKKLQSTGCKLALKAKGSSFSAL